MLHNEQRADDKKSVLEIWEIRRDINVGVGRGFIQ